MKTLFLLASLALAAVGCNAVAEDAAPAAAPAAQAAPTKPIRVLAFSKTNGFRHAKQIDLSHAMLKDFAKAGQITLDSRTGEKPEVFTDEVLKDVDVLVFLHTTDNPKNPLLNKEQRAAFEAFIQRGGGWVGVHGASDGGYDWPFLSEMLGAHFKCHPHQQHADLLVVDADHPSTAHMEKSMKHHEEWYDFTQNIHGKPEFRELLRVDEKTYKPAQPMGDDHPICWCREYKGGRAWYTELGHTEPQYKQEWFQKHILGGIQWAAKREKAAETKK